MSESLVIVFAKDTTIWHKAGRNGVVTHILADYSNRSSTLTQVAANQYIFFAVMKICTHHFSPYSTWLIFNFLPEPRIIRMVWQLFRCYT